MLFDWLVTEHVIDINPAHAVRGSKHSVRKVLLTCTHVVRTIDQDGA